MMHVTADVLMVCGSFLLWYAPFGPLPPLLFPTVFGLGMLLAGLGALVKIVAWSVGLRHRKARQ